MAGDLARLRDRLARRAGRPPRPLAIAALVAALVVLALALRLTMTGGEAPARTVAPPAPQSREAVAGEPEPVIPTLQSGDSGPAVRDLQTALAALGFYSQASDTSFGNATGAAVAAFQSERGLVVDGIAGPTTMSSLREAVAERAAADADTVARGLVDAVGKGRLPAGAAARYRAITADSLAALRRMPPGRSAVVGLVLRDLAAQADAYEGPRALTLFTMLAANSRYLARNAVPAGSLDIDDEDGVVYRFLPAHGFQFHPLANFARLNGLARSGERNATARLAKALLDRAITRGATLTWEYYFPFRGPVRWTSGLAQAAGAQALARSGRLLDDRTHLGSARAAYEAIPAQLSRELAGGIWVREYSFSDMPILNAQLQSIVSLSEYARIANDGRAQEFVDRMTASTRALLHRFDTGCWSRYSLDGSDAPTHYHTYHVSLLRQLARDTGEPLWRETANRWNGFLRAAGAPVSGPCVSP